MKKTAIISVVSLIIGIVLGVLADRQMIADDRQEPQIYSDTIVHTDTITYIDTVRYMKPIPKDSFVIRHQTITDTTHVIVNDKDTTIVTNYNVPITQKEYNDSTYHAWVSGYEPTLDSIYVFPKYQQINNTQQINTTITKIKYKNRHWGLGVSSGIGYSPQGFTPYVGVGIQYNIFTW
ncbi:MAG: hypothetical protein J6O49_13690 [Bacteroidaceae bacterium]|nr:hypothetical protein [Bacteroidaceae bacterium]